LESLGWAKSATSDTPPAQESTWNYSSLPTSWAGYDAASQRTIETDSTARPLVVTRLSAAGFIGHALRRDNWCRTDVICIIVRLASVIFEISADRVDQPAGVGMPQVQGLSVEGIRGRALRQIQVV
jgi:hypothetical protein